jgi:adenylate cyclase
VGDKHQQIVKTVPKRGYLMDVTVFATAPEAPPLSLPDKPSVVVLPFTNMSGDPEQEYFADGIVEGITTELSRFQDLFVIARNSSFRFKGRASDVRQVGRELGVRYLLEGSVRRESDDVRISAQLIDAMTGGHRWADRYDRKLDHVFAIQDEIARNVAAVLAAHVNKAEAERTLLKAPTIWQAYDYYLRASEVLAGFHPLAEPVTVYETRRLLDQCLALDPGFARAHVLYSMTKFVTWSSKLDHDHFSPAALESALDWAQRAVQLDPNLPQGHVQLTADRSRRPSWNVS